MNHCSLIKNSEKDMNNGHYLSKIAPTEKKEMATETMRSLSKEVW